MKYEFIKNGIARLVELKDNKVIEIRKFSGGHLAAKQYFENIREVERKRGSQIVLLEQDSGHKGKLNKLKKRKQHTNFDVKRKVRVMGISTRL